MSLIALIFLFSMVGCEATWSEFTPKSGLFTVSLPCDPKTSNDFKRMNSTSSVTSTIFICEPTLFKKMPTVLVSVAKYISWGLNSTTWNDEKMFKGFINGFTKHVKGKIIEENDSVLAGNYAREYVMITDNNEKVIVRVSRDNNNLFSLSIADDAKKDLSDDATVFFDSFYLNESSGDGGQ